jgi:cytoskeletal protein CcmA (bactofilin family)
MFSKDHKSKSGDSADASFSGNSLPSSSTPSIISADLQITGNLKSNGDIQIDGQIDGDVNSKSLTIGEGAEVNGTILCERVRVCGKVSGEIKATSVVLARSAKVSGDIAHKNLEIEAGATLEGGVRRLESEAGSSGGGKEKAPKSAASSVTKLADAPSGSASSQPANGSAAAV